MSIDTIGPRSNPIGSPLNKIRIHFKDLNSTAVKWLNGVGCGRMRSNGQIWHHFWRHSTTVEWCQKSMKNNSYFYGVKFGRGWIRPFDHLTEVESIIKWGPIHLNEIQSIKKIDNNFYS